MGLHRLGRDPVELQDLVRLGDRRDLVGFCVVHGGPPQLLGPRVPSGPSPGGPAVAAPRGRNGAAGGVPPRAGSRGPHRPRASGIGEGAIGTQLAPAARRARPPTRARRRPPAGALGPDPRADGPGARGARRSSSGVTIFLGFGTGPVGGWLEDGLRLLIGRAVALAPLAADRPRRRPDPRPPAARRPPLRLAGRARRCALLIALAGGVFGLGGIERDAWFVARRRERARRLPRRAGVLGHQPTVGGIGTAIIVVGGPDRRRDPDLGRVPRATSSAAAARARRSPRAPWAGASRRPRSPRTAAASAARAPRRHRPADAARAGRRPPPADSRPLLDGADAFPDIFGDPSALPPSPALGPAGRRRGRLRVADPGAGGRRRARTRPGRPGAGSRRTRRPRSSRSSRRSPRSPRAATAAYRAPAVTAPAHARAARPTQPEELVARTSRILEETLGHFGIEATVSDTVSGPARHALRAPARARHQGRADHRAARRPRLRPGRPRGAAHHRPDPRQAGRRRGGPEPRGLARDAGRHHPRVPQPTRGR